MNYLKFVVLILLFTSASSNASSPCREAFDADDIRSVEICSSENSAESAEVLFIIGITLYEKESFEIAYNFFSLSGLYGYHESKFFLGYMEQNGIGTEKNQSNAIFWYKDAAEHGIAEAQHNLAIAYTQGEGVIQDFVYAHVWFNIAGANGNQRSSEFRGKIEKLMTKDQIVDAQKIARECMKNNYKNC